MDTTFLRPRLRRTMLGTLCAALTLTAAAQTATHATPATLHKTAASPAAALPWGQLQPLPMAPMLDAAALTDADREQIMKILRADVVANRELTSGLNDAELNDELVAQRARLVDLDGDGQPELLLQSNGTVECVDDDSGNCTTRVLTRQGGVWRVALRTLAQSMTVDTTSGTPVLVLYRALSDDKGGVEAYRLAPRTVRAQRLYRFNVTWPGGQALQGSPKISASL